MIPEEQRRSPTFARSQSPTLTIPVVSSQVGRANDIALQVRTSEDIVMSSSSEGRKRRRHNQNARESQKIDREKDRKKPFYLTMNNEGKPYRPSRPAWIVDINKLAKGLIHPAPT